MELLLIGSVAFVAAALSFYSGFGLGTVLLPCFALFFPLPWAVAATAVVHAANNVMKVVLVGRHVNLPLLLRFGGPAVLAAPLGVATLNHLVQTSTQVAWTLPLLQTTVTPLKLVLALLMALFALWEWLPYGRSLAYRSSGLIVGGLLSGFFGGLSGHQGALRSAFLAKVTLDSRQFVGTHAVIGLAVDMVRLVAYAALIAQLWSEQIQQSKLGASILLAVIMAISGVMLASRFLKKITMTFIKNLTAFLLLAMALSLALGLI